MKGFKRIVVHPRCVHISKEFRNYSYKVDKHTEEIFPIIVDAFNHGIDAVRSVIGQAGRMTTIEKPRVRVPARSADSFANFQARLGVGQGATNLSEVLPISLTRSAVIAFCWKICIAVRGWLGALALKSCFNRFGAMLKV